jgi:hypothetical protein
VGRKNGLGLIVEDRLGTKVWNWWLRSEEWKKVVRKGVEYWTASRRGGVGGWLLWRQYVSLSGQFSSTGEALFLRSFVIRQWEVLIEQLGRLFLCCGSWLVDGATNIGW